MSDEPVAERVAREMTAEYHRRYEEWFQREVAGEPGPLRGLTPVGETRPGATEATA